MYAILNKNGKIDRIVSGNSGVTINDIQHPSNIFSLWSRADLKKIGVVECVESPSNQSDLRFYIEGADSRVVANDGLSVVNTKTYIPKDLAVVKKSYFDSINNTAHSILVHTDWRVVKKMETGKELPANVGAFRAAVRKHCNDTQDLVNAASTVTELSNVLGDETYHKWPNFEKDFSAIT